MQQTASHALDRVLVLEMVRVTEAAAIAASTLTGRGDEKAADAAAVEAMRDALNKLYLDGTVVIGEGERDEAPMLFIGEKVGAARQGSGDRHRARSARRHHHLRQGRPQCAGGACGGRKGRAAQRARRLHGQDRRRPGLSRGRDRPRQVGDRKCAGDRRRQGRAAARDHRLRARSPAPREADRRAARHRLRRAC
jgi:hypothetical protein